MAKKLEKNNSDHSATDDGLSNGRKASAKADGKASKASAKKVLSRKEKLEAAERANQAMMKAWKLISQREPDNTNGESNV
jgi:hypothetical protein